MLKKTITYTDYNGVERTEDFYFNLNESEITEMQYGFEGGLAQMLMKIINAQDAPAIIRVMKEIVLKSYGEKSPDGKRFIKSKELSEAFSQTEAYNQLYMELATDDKKGADVVNAIIPKTTAQKVRDELDDTLKEISAQ